MLSFWLLEPQENKFTLFQAKICKWMNIAVYQEKCIDQSRQQARLDPDFTVCRPLLLRKGAFELLLCLWDSLSKGQSWSIVYPFGLIREPVNSFWIDGPQPLSHPPLHGEESQQLVHLLGYLLDKASCQSWEIGCSIRQKKGHFSSFLPYLGPSRKFSGQKELMWTKLLGLSESQSQQREV